MQLVAFFILSFLVSFVMSFYHLLFGRLNVLVNIGFHFYNL